MNFVKFGPFYLNMDQVALIEDVSQGEGKPAVVAHLANKNLTYLFSADKQVRRNGADTTLGEKPVLALLNWLNQEDNYTIADLEEIYERDTVTQTEEEMREALIKDIQAQTKKPEWLVRRYLSESDFPLEQVNYKTFTLWLSNLGGVE